ncbi:hypothetical protein [Streptomyces aureoverticillatus]|uniref:hypothetical protein n=1 Tax=Streptomyces aureoverticillatus TaxID=66871 RepID=UPI0013DC01C4|nr:hypothetical protein [Streptomyces aureoverticillatus]QIB43487.1 hypothetical protein G3H79_10770 [Streptomyces aureoverticillatus]
MKTRTRASVLAAPLVLTALTGCGMTDDEKDGVPFAGTSTSSDASDAMEKVSSSIYRMIGVKGKASDNFPGVTECSGKDTKTHFRIFHPWSFTPAKASDLDEAMERLKRELPKHGWKIVEYGPDTSRNKNLNLTADNDKKKVSVNVIKMSKNDTPKLSLNLVSGCYKVPDGEKVDRYPS